MIGVNLRLMPKGKLMLSDAIQFYHDLLTPELAEASDIMMRRRLKEETLYFGARPLCVVLRPHFYTESNWQFVKQGLEAVLKAFKTLHEALLESPELRAHLRLHDYEEALIGIDKSGVPPWTSSRLDTFFLQEERILKIVEYNAETPAGIGYGEVLADVFNELEIVKRFGKKYHIRQIRSLHRLSDALMEGYRSWGGKREKPQIAILDWQNVPTLNEHEITRQHLQKLGYTAILADPRTLSYRNGHLFFRNFRIDMIYKRVLYSELIETMGIENPIVRAMRDGNVYITNSISCKMLAKKASLALLSDERFHHLYSAEEHKAIAQFVPWTRVIEDRKTIYKGKEIDLLDYVANHKDEFTLKPNDDYGGSGVVLGWTSSTDAWRAKLQVALEHPHVVQEKVQVVERDFPMWLNGKVDISSRFVDADPYIFNGNRVDGVLTRLSPLALLNVTAGGGSVVPTCVIDKK